MITYKHNNIKNELDTIYDHIVEGIRIRSKCNWYEHNKNQRFFFLILKNNDEIKSYC